MATWTALRPGGNCFAIGGADLAAFVRHKPTKPTAFKDAWEPQALSDPVMGEMPRIALEAGSPPAQLARFVTAFERGALCDACSGRGMVQKTAITGYRRDGGVKVPIRSTADRDCGPCGATGLGNAQAIDRSLARLIEGVVEMDLQAPGAAEVVSGFEQVAATVAGGAKDGGRALATRSLARLFTTDAATLPALRSPVAAVGRLFEAHGHAGERLVMAALGDGRYVVLTDLKVGSTYGLGRLSAGSTRGCSM